MSVFKSQAGHKFMSKSVVSPLRPLLCGVHSPHTVGGKTRRRGDDRQNASYAEAKRMKSLALAYMYITGFSGI